MSADNARVIIAPRVSLKASLRAVFAVATTTVVLFTSGCSNMYSPSVDNTPAMGAAIQGKVHGGQSPISGSAIQLVVAGSTGYGSAGTNLLMTPVTSGADGSFTITNDYTCPTPGSLVYLTASGGNPGVGSNNSAIMLTAPLGACGSLTGGTFIIVNEVTTAATAVALGQFFTPTFGSSSTDSFGTSSTNSVGLTNAFATAINLVNTATGSAVATATLNGTGTGAGLTITATPESAKLNTIANVLAACVNSDGGGSSPCATTLFPDVTSTGGTAPTDTLQAAVYMSLNPSSNNAGGSTANLTALYGLQTATAPFVGVSTQPTDWTVGILYQGSSALSQSQNIAADAAGNIWVATSQSGASALVEFSPTGTPMLSSALSTTTVNGGSSVSLTSSSPRNVAIDTNGNVWVTASSGSGAVFEYNPNTAAATAFKFQASYGVTIDGNNNVFISDQSASVGTTGNSFIEFLNGNMDPSTEIEYPADEAVIQPEYLAADTSGNVWASSGSASGTNAVLLSGINTSGCTAFPCSSATGLVSSYTTLTAGPINGPWAFAAAPAGGAWLANATGNLLTNFAAGGASAQNFGSASSLNAPRFPAMDGAGNIWVGNRGTAAISEFAGNGTVLSPGTGYAHSGLASANQVTLDPSGNVWVANNSTSTNANSIFEIVGSGAPTVTPIALSLKNSKVGQKP
jgi:hypothetical protein